MKKESRILICGLFGLLLLNCCSCKKTIVYGAVKPMISVDDTIKSLLGDTVCQIIFNAETIELFELEPQPIVKIITDSVQVDSLWKDSIFSLPDSVIIQEIIQRDTLFHGYAIKKNFGILSQEQVMPFLFLMSDRYAYSYSENYPSAPFIASVAMRLTFNGRMVDMIFSFSGGLLQVYTDKDEYQLIKYNYERLFMRYFQVYLQDTTIQYLLDNNF